MYNSPFFESKIVIKTTVRTINIIRHAIVVTTAAWHGEAFIPPDLVPPDWDCAVSRYPMGILSVTGLTDDNYKEYISNKQVKALVRGLYKLDLNYLRVDSKNNVFLSPRPFSRERAFMMRVNDSTTIEENKHIRIEGAGTFTHYKGNWYIADVYIEKYDIDIDALKGEV